MVVMITSEEYKELVIKANKYDELQKSKMSSEEKPKHMAIEDADKIEKIEIQKITPKEMGDILDNLKNKIVGGK